MSLFSSSLNTQIVTPEIVLLGMTGHGKSSVLEGLLGHTVTHVGYNGKISALFTNN